MPDTRKGGLILAQGTQADHFYAKPRAIGPFGALRVSATAAEKKTSTASMSKYPILPNGFAQSFPAFIEEQQDIPRTAN